MSARDAAIHAVEQHPSTTFMAPCESLADAVLAAAAPLLRAEALIEGAVELERIADETEARVAEHYGTGSGIGPGSAEMVREAARTLRSLAGEKATAQAATATPDADPLIVDRFDTAVEPAPEDPPVLIVGAVASDGRPVALFFDAEARDKVAAWLAPAPLDSSRERKADRDV
ncbi:hypothetical protein GKQ77_01465 [Streptomyces sp. BG9H]|uniref:Uncharacterized protein n=1 Tax=Streptomyces anatolicus TaxID=2675858 RepID=A0ABS6YFP7_9ACTN|nr:hypothetical protein [Streptomyces anatolicus]MBW5420238.1 hypothetical protein [Streptomyces anatolicus]